MIKWKRISCWTQNTICCRPSNSPLIWEKKSEMLNCVFWWNGFMHLILLLDLLFYILQILQFRIITVSILYELWLLSTFSWINNVLQQTKRKEKEKLIWWIPKSSCSWWDIPHTSTINPLIKRKYKISIKKNSFIKPDREKEKKRKRDQLCLLCVIYNYNSIVLTHGRSLEVKESQRESDLITQHFSSRQERIINRIVNSMEFSRI